MQLFERSATGLRCAHRGGYLPEPDFATLDHVYHRICRGLVLMMQQPEKWGSTGSVREPVVPYLPEP